MSKRSIVIVDTEDGEHLPAAYRESLPHCTFKGFARPEEKGTPTHPHGRMCGWLAAASTFPHETEVSFIRIFDSASKPVWHDRWYFPLLRDMPPMQSFHAAGNDDANDADPDVDYPQSERATRLHVIGSHNRAGVPSVWSGDRAGAVECSTWAEDIWLHDGLRWEIGSGTSFACPKIAGLCAAVMNVPVISHSWGAWDGDQGDQEVNSAYWTTWAVEYLKAIRADETAGVSAEWQAFVRQNATRPIGTHADRHAKWGWGSMEDEWQRRLHSAMKGFIPSAKRARPAAAWMDYRRIAA
ncbi:MAG: S8/S53 family peptidase [Xanthomonadales bacterium]|nr:S8/S53 family peptidase [Xanthomonadales bacterium]